MSATSLTFHFLWLQLWTVGQSSLAQHPAISYPPSVWAVAIPKCLFNGCTSVSLFSPFFAVLMVVFLLFVGRIKLQFYCSGAWKSNCYFTKPCQVVGQTQSGGGRSIQADGGDSERKRGNSCSHGRWTERGHPRAGEGRPQWQEA